MQIILSDHDCEGHAQQIIFALNRSGLAAIAPVQLVLPGGRGLPVYLMMERLSRANLWQ